MVEDDIGKAEELERFGELDEPAIAQFLFLFGDVLHVVGQSGCFSGFHHFGDVVAEGYTTENLSDEEGFVLEWQIGVGDGLGFYKTGIVFVDEQDWQADAITLISGTDVVETILLPFVIRRFDAANVLVKLDDVSEVVFCEDVVFRMSRFDDNIRESIQNWRSVREEAVLEIHIKVLADNLPFRLSRAILRGDQILGVHFDVKVQHANG